MPPCSCPAFFFFFSFLLLLFPQYFLPFCSFTDSFLFDTPSISHCCLLISCFIMLSFSLCYLFAFAASSSFLLGSFLFHSTVCFLFLLLVNLSCWFFLCYSLSLLLWSFFVILQFLCVCVSLYYTLFPFVISFFRLCFHSILSTFYVHMIFVLLYDIYFHIFCLVYLILYVQFFPVIVCTVVHRNCVPPPILQLW